MCCTPCSPLLKKQQLTQICSKFEAHYCFLSRSSVGVAEGWKLKLSEVKRSWNKELKQSDKDLTIKAEIIKRKRFDPEM